MKIFTGGAMCEACQLQRINKAFIGLGHKIQMEEPTIADLVYYNNPPYWSFGPNSTFKGKRIFNILDLFVHLNDEKTNQERQLLINTLKKCILDGAAITTISTTVQAQLANFGVQSEVIFQPIMNVGWLNLEKKHPFKYLFVGRLRDPNKRISIGVQALQMLGVKPEEVATVGSENIGWGAHLGVVSEQVLNELYNSVDFVICPSKEEGILLPMIEAMACRAIPVICNDLSTRQEFLPSEHFFGYDENFPNALSLAHFLKKYRDPGMMQVMKDKLFTHWSSELQYKFTAISVANRILSIYNKM